eukprot:TRINITY_DN105112_c1_g1_i1.p1 TRINITY_DN105112_c1_g1~~TRINITY_DN105112_c1_g1_i1.p1  ORF type:complete len:308 (+),score=27.80 TRINITY_DN105112_c1_g1_i1:355-1278(+)
MGGINYAYYPGRVAYYPLDITSCDMANSITLCPSSSISQSQSSTFPCDRESPGGECVLVRTVKGTESHAFRTPIGIIASCFGKAECHTIGSSGDRIPIGTLPQWVTYSQANAIVLDGSTETFMNYPRSSTPAVVDYSLEPPYDPPLNASVLEIREEVLVSFHSEGDAIDARQRDVAQHLEDIRRRLKEYDDKSTSLFSMSGMSAASTWVLVSSAILCVLILLTVLSLAGGEINLLRHSIQQGTVGGGVKEGMVRMRIDIRKFKLAKESSALARTAMKIPWVNTKVTVYGVKKEAPPGHDSSGEDEGY